MSVCKQKDSWDGGERERGGGRREREERERKGGGGGVIQNTQPLSAFAVFAH